MDADAVLATTVPPITLDWLPSPANTQTPVHRFICAPPRPLVATEGPFPQNRPSAIDLAFESQRLLDEGVVNSRADIARRYGVSRARVTQVMSILRLPPGVLYLLANSGQAVWSERQLRGILALPSQEDQTVAFGRLWEQREQQHCV